MNAYDSDITDRFIDLRAQDLSLASIAEKLHVSKRSLVLWNRKFRDDIRALRAVELEALHKRIFPSRDQHLARLAKILNRIETDMADGPLGLIDFYKLARAAAIIRHQIREFQTDFACLDDPTPASGRPLPSAPAQRDHLPSTDPPPGQGSPRANQTVSGSDAAGAQPLSQTAPFPKIPDP